jgi:hypothetical protein
VQLGNDDALSAVDDERPVFCHQRNFAEIDLLLLDVLDGLVRRILVDQDQANAHSQWRSVGGTTQLAFFDVEYRSAERVIHIFKARGARIAFDRKHGFERRVQAGVDPPVGRDVGLGKLPIGIQLNRQEIRLLHNFGQLAEVLANPFLFSK